MRYHRPILLILATACSGRDAVLPVVDDTSGLDETRDTTVNGAGDGCGSETTVPISHELVPQAALTMLVDAAGTYPVTATWFDEHASAADVIVALDLESTTHSVTHAGDPEAPPCAESWSVQATVSIEVEEPALSLTWTTVRDLPSVPSAGTMLTFERRWSPRDIDGLELPEAVVTPASRVAARLELETGEVVGRITATGADGEDSVVFTIDE